MFFRSKPARQHSRQTLVGIADTAIVAMTGILCVGFIMSVAQSMTGLMYPKIYDPLALLIQSQGAGGWTLLRDVAGLHILMNYTILGAAGIGFFVMMMLVFARGLDKRRWHSPAVSSSLLLLMATSLPHLVLEQVLARMEVVKAVPGGLGIVVEAINQRPSGVVAQVIFYAWTFTMMLPIVWYRFAVEYERLPGARFLPRGLRPSVAVES